MGGMTSKGPVDLSGMDRRFFEALSPDARVELLCRLHALAVEQAEKLARDSTNSSRPPSSDGPFGPASATPTGTVPPLPPASSPAPEPPARSGRKAGKQRGSKGIWRCEALVAERDENHYPMLCAACGTPFEMWERSQRPLRARPGAHGRRHPDRLHPAPLSCDRVCLRCSDRRAARCRCAVDGAGVLARSAAERSLPAALATFIAALSVRYHVSRAKIREFLAVWFGVPLSVGTLDRCIREVGVACEPVVEDLLGDLRQAGVIHADETPWKQHGRLRWLWVVL